MWRYKFSQLKGSSDDGKTRVKLLFKNAESKQIEMKVMHLCYFQFKDIKLLNFRHVFLHWLLNDTGELVSIVRSFTSQVFQTSLVFSWL